MMMTVSSSAYGYYSLIGRRGFGVMIRYSVVRVIESRIRKGDRSVSMPMVAEPELEVSKRYYDGQYESCRSLLEPQPCQQAT